MMQIWGFITILCLVVIQCCHGASGFAGLESRAQAIALTGARADQDYNSPNLRREINDFVKLNDGRTANLFLLALRRLYRQNKDDPMSFWEIAGIHGRPHRPWNNEIQTGTGGGWAPHASTLFLPWHRAFMAFFEQVIYQNAQQMLSTATLEFQAGYKQALQDLRLPYFDWMANDGQMPEILTQPKWNVTLPDTFLAYIDNPLYQSVLQNGTFNDIECFPHSPMNTWNHSVRNPDSRGVDAASGMTGIQQRLAASVKPSQAKIRALLLDEKFSTWSTFSNEGSNGAKRQSVEALHNEFHSLIGGYNAGHMKYYDYAAFDPIFYLSHANLDRLLAMWQVLHPDQWVTPQANLLGNFGTLARYIESAETPLRPFRKANGIPWTSESIRNITLLGYMYPELQYEIEGNGTGGLREHVRGEVERLYGS